MSDEPLKFFPARASLNVRGFALTDFPFPLALTYERLLETMERQEPVAAVWAMRDAFEAALKLTASLAMADLLNEHSEMKTLEKVAGLLLKTSGLSAGDWHKLLVLALEPLAVGRTVGNSRILPGLYPVFFQTAVQITGKPKPTPLNRRIDGGNESYVHWRNTVIGHGVFKRERALYAHDVETWLTHLHAFYDALRPVLQGWRLVGKTPDDEIIWQGTTNAALDAVGLAPHRHQPWGDPLPMFFEYESDGTKRRLAFGPLLSIQQCTVCKQPAVFFFDKHQVEKDDKGNKEDKHATSFLEYFWGESRRLKDWPEAQKYVKFLAPNFQWQRTAYQTDEIDRMLDQLLHRFDREYVRPEHLFARLSALVQEQEHGYIHLVAPEGFGKTYFVRGIDEEPRVLVYHIQPGALADYQVFLTEVNNQARRSDKLGIVTLDAQVNEKTMDAAQGQFVSYLQELARQSGAGPLIIAIDGLDELGASDNNSTWVTDLLPPASQLPPKMFFLLTSRETLRPTIRQDLDRLRAQSGPLYTSVEVTSSDTENQELLRAYLRKRLPAQFRSEANVEEVLRLSQGIFLYAYHQCSALEEGSFADVAALPEAGRFYAAYLERLQTQVDGTLFKDVYLKTLLLLSVVREPVSQEQLHRWGVPNDKLSAALYDLRSFLRIHRALSWQNTLSNTDGEGPFYEMAHEAFVRFVTRDPVLAPQLISAHETIARHSLAKHGELWQNVNPTETADLYDLRYVLPHLEQAGMKVEVQALRGNQDYANACSDAEKKASNTSHFYVAIALSDIEVATYRFLVEAGHAELTGKMAGSLTSKGTNLYNAELLADALDCYKETIALLRPLVEGGNTKLALDLATALGNKGITLQGLGHFREALESYNEAIAILRPFVAGGRTEFTHHLTETLTSKGIILTHLGHLPEALENHDEAIAILRPLVASGRAELAHHLANALVMKGVTLGVSDHLDEALDRFEEAIAILRPLVDAGHVAVTQALGLALMGKDTVLMGLGRRAEGQGCSDEGIAMLERLDESS